MDCYWGNREKPYSREWYTTDQKEGSIAETEKQLASEEVVVPRTAVGMIIGKGGATIRRIGQDSGALIQFNVEGKHKRVRLVITYSE